uniref:Leucine-rich repeat-containing protein 4C n=1 Tax=Melanaphis sacchari TaxID=742174 RepID=A0A2H8TQI4_9HEMI
MARRWHLWLAAAVLAAASVTLARADACPIVCQCKWKSGKQSVECRDKSLITVPTGIDTVTQVLDVSGNNLQILPENAFARLGLLNLQRVYLSRCRIGQIDGRALKGLTNAVEIDLSRNMLTAVPTDTLVDVPLLRDLSLAGNPIQRVGPEAFRHCTGLVRLDLSGCDLRQIAASAFVGIDQLETLKLNNNRLTELMAGTVATLHKVHGVELHENPWHCDCRMRPVKMWLTDNNVPTTVDPACATGPGRVANRTFSSLAADDFACQPDILQQDDQTVHAATGDNASVSCRVQSSPAAKVSWYWNGRPLANNTAFGPFQRVFMTDDRTATGGGAGHSSLLLTNVQPSDSGQFLCVAENRAGRAEANFTLVVTRLGGLAFLANGQVAGLSVFLVFLIVTILLVIVYLLVRIKRLPPASTRSDGKPHQLVTTAASATSNGTAAVVVQVKQPTSGSATGPAAATTVVTSSAAAVAGGPYGGYGNAFDHTMAAEAVVGGIRRPEKLAELSFTADHYEATGFGHNGVPDTGRTVLYRSQASNPDLIVDAPEQQSLQSQSPGAAHHQSARRSTSGEYRRTADDSLYSPGFWTASDAAANDRTPIIEKSPPLPAQSATAVCGVRETVVAAPDPKAASLRVWKHGVQVMPPLSALKRALNKGSPDEGYQEGCGTDV